jgi:hypothetical protein
VPHLINRVQNAAMPDSTGDTDVTVHHGLEGVVAFET